MSVTRASNSASEPLGSVVVTLQDRLSKALKINYKKAFDSTYQPRYHKERFTQTKQPLAIKLEDYCTSKLDTMEKIAAFIGLYHYAVNKNEKADPKRWFDVFHAKSEGGDLGYLLRGFKPDFDELESKIKLQIKEHKNFLLLKFEFLKLHIALAKQSRAASVMTNAGLLLAEGIALPELTYYSDKLAQKKKFLEDYKEHHSNRTTEIESLLAIALPQEIYDSTGQIDPLPSIQSKLMFEKTLIDQINDVNCQLMDVRLLEHALQGDLCHLSLQEQIYSVVREEIFRNFADPLAETLINEEKLYYWILNVRLLRNKSEKHGTRCVENFNGRNEMEQELLELLNADPSDHDKHFLNADLLSNLNSSFQDEKENLIQTIIEDVKNHNDSLINVRRFEARPEWKKIFNLEGCYRWKLGFSDFMNEQLITPLLELKSLAEGTVRTEKVVLNKKTSALALNPVKKEVEYPFEEIMITASSVKHVRTLFEKAKTSLTSIANLTSNKRSVQDDQSPLRAHTCFFAQPKFSHCEPEARSLSLNS